MIKKTRALVALLAAAGCSSSLDPSADAPTYHRDVRGIVEARCATCHRQGGVAPFALDDYATLSAFSSAALASVEAGTMPPWLPDAECRTYEDARLMPEAEKDVLRRWVAAGAPQGDPADYVAPASKVQALELEDLGPPTASLAYDQGYAPDASGPDDYRCFPLDMQFEQERYLHTSHVVPDQEALVHHVILYLVPPQFAELVDELDAGDPGPGYGCFGGVGAGAPTPIAGWTPGDAPAIGREDAGIRIPAGARLVLQMHYNTLAAAPAPDRTRVDLWMHETRPDYLVTPRFFPHLGVDIAAGDPASSNVRVFTNNSDAPWTIVGTSPHMHLLGKSQRVVHVDAAGKEACLVDIPRWDFDWQQSYILTEPMVVAPGEALRMECVYDNSDANQPIVDGVRRTPERVTWGEGTLDEMCLNTVIMLEPYTALPEPEDQCGGFQACYDECKTSSGLISGCILRCGAANGCAACLLPGMFSQTSGECGVQGAGLIECLERCGGAEIEDEAACVTERCGIHVVSFDQCARPALEGGAFERTADACGVQL